MRSKSHFHLPLFFSALISVICLPLCGCHKTVLVFGPTALPALPSPGAQTTDSDKMSELPGIPFYSHYGVCTKETLWLEPQTTLSLTVSPKGEDSVTQAITLNNKAFHDSNSDALSLVNSLKEVDGNHTITDQDKSFCPANVAKKWTAVREHYKVKPIGETGAAIGEATNEGVLVRISNTADVGAGVDYSRVYYLNSKAPLIGSSSVDAHLSEDGTLSEGSASVDDQTLSAVLTAAATVGSAGLSAWSTVAAATIAGAAAVATNSATPAITGLEKNATIRNSCDAGEGWPAIRSTEIKYKFVITPGGFKHDHKIVKPLNELANRCEVGDDVMNGSYTVTPVSQESKSDDDAIGVSGSITLPKPKPAKKPKG